MIKLSGFNQRLKNSLYTAIYDFVLFVILFLYIWLKIEPNLIFQRQEPVFFLDLYFFKEFLKYPGGLLDYISAFLSQFHYISWAGAAILTCLAWLLAFATRKFIQSFNKSKPVQILHFIPVILYLILHSQYNHPLSISIGLLISLSVFIIFTRIAPSKISFRLLLFLFFLFAIYYLAAGSCFLFTLLCAIFEFSKKKQTWSASTLISSFYILSAAILPYIARETIFIISMKDAYVHSLPLFHHYKPEITPYVLYLFFPSTAIFQSVLRRQIHTTEFKSKTSAVQFLIRLVSIISTKPKLIIQRFALFLFAGSAAFYSFDINTKANLQVDYFARQKMWKQVLLAAENQISDNIIVHYHTNRALYHTDRLLSDMFSFSQVWQEKGLLFPQEYAYFYPLLISDLYFELGHIGEARHWAYEAQAVSDNSPWNIQRLALINILEGNHVLARRYLTLLNKTILFRDRAKYYSRCLYDKSLLDEHKDLGHISSIMVDNDFIVHNAFPQDDLIELLKSNRQNKMAFEYLIAYYLLTRQLDQLFKNVQRLKDFNYHEIPRHYEEALLVYLSMTGGKNLSLDKYHYQFKMETVQRFRDFYRILNSYRYDTIMAREKLQEEHGDTYWYYLFAYGDNIKPALDLPSLSKPGTKR